MKLSLAPDGSISLESALVSLRGLRPVLNGEFLPGDPVTLRAEPAGAEVDPGAVCQPAGDVHHRIALVGTGRCDLRCRGGPAGDRGAGRIRAASAQSRTRAFCAYTSWDGGQLSRRPAGRGRDHRLRADPTAAALWDRQCDRRVRPARPFPADVHRGCASAPPSLTIDPLGPQGAQRGTPESERLGSSSVGGRRGPARVGAHRRGARRSRPASPRRHRLVLVV